MKTKDLRVDVKDRCEHPGDREDTALVKLIMVDHPCRRVPCEGCKTSGTKHDYTHANDPEVVLMTEVITGTSGAHASKLAHERADAIRKGLGLLNTYSVSDGTTKLCDVDALDMKDALVKLSQYTLDPKYRSLRIDLVER